MLNGIARAWLVLVLAFLPEAAPAQGMARIWDVELGSPIADLPPAFMITACGTNGGPPSTFLEGGFADFARCPIDQATGLYEIWFSYDDESEYYQRAIRAPPVIIETARANNLFEQLVIYSLLIDADGLVQGYRIVTDPRESPTLRRNADSISLPMKVLFGGSGWECTDLPRRDGEEPFGGIFKKERCEKISEGRHITLETHRFLKAGQRVGPGTPREGEFEVWVRVDVINETLVRD